MSRKDPCTSTTQQIIESSRRLNPKINDLIPQLQEKLVEWNRNGSTWTSGWWWSWEYERKRGVCEERRWGCRWRSGEVALLWSPRTDLGFGSAACTESKVQPRRPPRTIVEALNLYNTNCWWCLLTTLDPSLPFCFVCVLRIVWSRLITNLQRFLCAYLL